MNSTTHLYNALGALGELADLLTAYRNREAERTELVAPLRDLHTALRTIEREARLDPIRIDDLSSLDTYDEGELVALIAHNAPLVWRDGDEEAQRWTFAAWFALVRLFISLEEVLNA